VDDKHNLLEKFTREQRVQLTALFFKKSWPIIHGSVTEAIRSFFTSGKLLKEVNSTIISLIPKVPNPTTVSDFRPIACCNVIYKCITKILANRLQIYLGSLVSSNQSAFIKGRSISENILLAQELLRNYHSSGDLADVQLKQI
jgi:hypothetical protein